MLALRVALRSAVASPGGGRAAAAAVAASATRTSAPPAAAVGAVRWASADAAAPVTAAGGEPSAKVQQLVETVVSLNMLEVKELTDALKARLGIDDSALGGGMPMMNPAMFAAAAGAPAGGTAAEEAAAPVAEKTAFDLKLLSFEPAKKIGVIKEVRSLTNLGLKEAKALVEDAPKVFMTGVAKADAEGIRDKIEGLGGKVALE
ncbi:hypothetical protein MMPV_000645 [Pyropia vietnamensis]